MNGKNNKPKIFVASSTEALVFAQGIHKQLKEIANVTTWEHIFKPTINTLDNLIVSFKDFNYGIFLFAPDDDLHLRGIVKKSTRDNVLFELGLFLGMHKKENVFILFPDRDYEEPIHLPTDLSGMTLIKYEFDRKGEGGAVAVSTACSELRESITSEQKKISDIKSHVVLSTLNTLSEDEIAFLKTFAEHSSSKPEGVIYHEDLLNIIKNTFLLRTKFITILNKLCQMELIHRDKDINKNTCYYKLSIKASNIIIANS